MKNLIIFLTFLLTISSCIKKDDPCNISGGKYEFVLPFSLSPAQETYHIGDTITISSMVTNPVYERKTGNSYYLDDFKFYMINQIWFMDTIDNYKNYDFFKLIIDSSYYSNIFHFSNGTSDLQFQYNYISNYYTISFKIIPQKKGRFLMTLWSDIEYMAGDQEFDGKCKNIKDHAVIYLNNRQDNNINLIDEAENQNYQSVYINKESNYLDAGGYCFKVIE